MSNWNRRHVPLVLFCSWLAGACGSGQTPAAYDGAQSSHGLDGGGGTGDGAAGNSVAGTAGTEAGGGAAGAGDPDSGSSADGAGGGGDAGLGAVGGAPLADASAVSTDGGGSPAADGAAPPDAGLAGPAGDGGGSDASFRHCTGNPDFGATVSEMQVAQALPTPMGGPLPGGYLIQTAHAIYTGSGGASGPNGKTRRGTKAFVLGGGAHVNELLFLEGVRVERTDSVRVEPTSLVLTRTCPSAETAVSVGYTADGTTVTLIDPAANTVETWTKH
jgi:hypothetical protein